MTARLVEASAGTGKTTEIIRVVTELIEQGAGIEEILLVTFTEKATGELKSRIRQRLTERARESEHARNAVNALDRASIFTIHGFCNQLLVQYAFELGQALETSLTRDEEFVFELLAAEERTWPAEFGSDLPAVLQQAGFPSYNGKKRVSQWEADVCSIVGRYQPGDVIDPASNEDRPLEEGSFLKRRTILRLLAAIEKRKAEQGMITYSDMLYRVRDALPSGVLLQQIRARYRHAIVDEFQDTDLIQWEIFRTCFFDSPGHTLTVVGDPKQAIYGFRGANVYTYEEARQQIRARYPAGPADELDTCYRSTDALISRLNRLFAHRQWFADRYHPVRAACKNEQVLDQAEQERALVAARFSGDERAASVKYRYAQFIAGEVGLLLSRGVPAESIAILVRSRGEARPIEMQLRRAGIPSRFYKKPGVYQSEEALQWQIMLRAIATLSLADIRAALLTCFFRTPPEDVIRGGDPSDDVMQRFREWNTLALRGKWARLFRSVLVDTAAVFPDTGLSVPVPEADSYEARRVNLEQLAQDLESAALRERLSIDALVDFLRARRQEQVMVDENSSLYRDENSRRSVRVMTMHVAKGLEFNIVFVAGSITAMGPRAPFIFFSSENGQRVRRFVLEGRTPPELTEQALEEERRLLYVALTRAVERVYVPFFYCTRKNPGGRGAAQTILHPCLRDTEGVTFVDGDVYRRAAASAPAVEHAAGGEILSNYVLDMPGLEHRSTGIESYSSLKRLLAMQEEPASFGETEADPDRNADDGAGESEAETEIKTDRKGNFIFTAVPESLPGGAAAGLTLHDILEDLDFALFDTERPPAMRSLPDELQRRIEKAMAVRRFEGGNYSRMILEMLWHTLNADLPGCGRLALVREKRHEVSFFLKVDFPGSVPLPRHITFREGYLHGAVDLVFSVEGRTYLADWKSDRLPAYDQSTLQQAMREKHYDLQAAIYAEVVQRWLKPLPGTSFGGTFYLFLRGMRTGASQGILFLPPEARRLEDILMEGL